ncbi:site-specific integrase [Sphingomonas panacisoli]|uniref:Site-specific integrase n=1 Tax=Sphingomonas panacisoli TaxID=1813879 RepID=A0A5B8LFV1_9SPHN|nr:site-specific integrase [Sphingomonas panacisoli]QDZ06933.1 site-specific integrase [Sphingomonas panacisoli]
MTRIKGLWEDPRSGIFYLRRKVPEALRPLFNCGELYKVTLRTSDRREAEKRLAIENGEFEKKIAAFRETLKKQGGGALSPEEAQALVERHLTRRSGTGFASGGLDVGFILRELDDAVEDLAGERLPTAQSMTPEDWIAYRKRVAGSDTDDELSDETIARLEAEIAISHRAPGDCWFDYQRRTPRRRWRPLLAEQVAALKRQIGLAEGNVPGIDEPLADAIAAALASPEIREQTPREASLRRRPNKSRARPDMNLRDLAAEWKDKRKPTLKMQAAADKAVADFTSYLGDIGIGEITADDCFEYRDAVAQMPKSMPRTHRKLAFVDQHALYSRRDDLDRVMPASIKKYLGAIQALLGFAFQERYIPANVAAGIKVEGYSKKGDRRPFTKDELAKLFKDPLFAQPWSIPQSKSAVSDITLRWLFLLGLMTGGRIEELGQVLLTDVKTEQRVPYIDVTDYVDPDVETEQNRVKTEGSRRVLPLHPKLIELGFMDYVERQRASGAVRLFRDLKADKLGVKTKEASRRAARVIDHAVSKDPRIVFYSFRHTFKDLCRDADIPKDVHDQLTGHAPADVGGGYGFGRAVANLHRHIKRLKLGFIDWNAIESAART